MHILASLNGKLGTAPYFPRENRELSPFSIRSLRCGGMVTRNCSNARFRDMIFNDFDSGIKKAPRKRDVFLTSL